MGRVLFECANDLATQPLYGPDVQAMYKRGLAPHLLPPHLFAVVRRAYEDMLNDFDENQV